MNAPLRTPLGKSSPREIRQANDTVAVRHLHGKDAGKVIGQLTEDWQHYLHCEFGIGDVLVQEVAANGDDVVEIVTLDGDAVAYIGCRSDLGNVIDALHPMKEAAE